MKKIFIFFILLIFSISAESFEDYAKQQSGAFDEYKENLEKDFTAYVNIINEEYDKYKKEIKETWNDDKISDKKEWVQYSDNMKNRRIVDFDKEEITIEAVVDEKISNEEIEKLFLIEFGNLILTDTATAYKNDKLMQNIDKRLEKELNTVQEKSKPDKKPILADIYLNKESDKDLTLSQADVQKTLEIAKTAVSKVPVKEKKAKEKGKKVISINIPMPSDAVLKKAKGFKKDVFKYSKAEKVDASLVYAIMHSESSFNPMARSHIPAYGLMQIVPQSAGRDVSKKLYGEDKVFTPKYLYDSSNNIKAGSAYLNILYYRYLKSIDNPVSRLYCTIAAYNTGAGNVAKAFTGKTNINEASKIINKMTPEQVYNKLIKNLPYDETKNYLKKVSERVTMYENVLEKGF
jgi:membrane-bound lytic murein transglycosylase C